jgi:hypothetical protein
MNRYIQVFGAIILLSLLAGCNQDASVEPPHSNVLDALIGPITAVSQHASVALPISEEDARRLLSEGSRANSEFVRILARAADWREADAGIRRALLEEHPVEVQHLREQWAATKILRSHLLSGPQQPERLDALAHFTRILVNTGNPEAQLIARALVDLDGHISEQERSDMAGAAARAAEPHAARTLNCTDCALAEMLRYMPPHEEGRARQHIAATLDAISTLYQIHEARTVR